MLDETTCPVCGKDLKDERISLTPTDQPIWAVAHYLAHLVQQKVVEGFTHQIDERSGRPHPR